MAYNVTLRTKSIAGEVNIFDSTMVRWVTGGVTLDASKVREIDGRKRLSIGEFLAKVTDSSGNILYAPVKRSVTGDAAAADQKEIPLDQGVMGGAAYFQVGDVIIVGEGDSAEEATIAAIDYDDHVLTVEENLSGSHAKGTLVRAKAGGEAAVMLGETVDFELTGGTYGNGNQVAIVFDWARVLTARLPRTPDEGTKAALTGITFV